MKAEKRVQGSKSELIGGYSDGSSLKNFPSSLFFFSFSRLTVIRCRRSKRFREKNIEVNLWNICLMLM